MASVRMTYLQHLEELRRRIIVSAIALGVAFAVAWIFAWDILTILKAPAGTITLNYMTPMEPFLVRFKLALFGAVVLAIPVVLFEILSFASPALKAKERRYTVGVMVMIVAFFAVGVIFGYRVIMPPGLRWLFGVAGTQMKPVLSASQYVTFMGWFMIGLGVSFETPVFIWMLVALGVVTPEQLTKQWRWAIIIILIVASVITPDWSPVTMTLVAIPMGILYIVSIALAKLTTRKRRAAAAAIEAAAIEN
ncbi:MAG TPA: twin-arginine translocase subunit TatC [Candidatus Anoxymicrobiaceae bacterium]